VIKTAEKIQSQKLFSELLMEWDFRHNSRQMPWKGEKDPYRIWLSEIILQQTRVEQGLAYYEKFINAFPTVHDLAMAPDETVFKLWEGLGYYTRCRNLLETARYISREYNGNFPKTYDDIVQLKGVGPYTAAAISSFAFNLPNAVVDGNVFRVLSRVFGISLPIDSTNGKKYFTQLANQVIDNRQPGKYNQAIMDFGATICKPVAALCSDCSLKKICYAFCNNKINVLPVKEKKSGIRKRFFYYIVIEHGNKKAVRQRTGRDIWNQLHEFPLVEMDRLYDSSTILAYAVKQDLLHENNYQLVSVSPIFKQQLTHQLITGQFLHVKINKPYSAGWEWATPDRMRSLAFPKFINQFLELV
jgi:A/G-specific adenine glycosylase